MTTTAVDAGRAGRRRRWLRWVLVGVVLLGTVLALAPALVFPEYRPIDPSGPHAVRTTAYEVVDGDRADPFSETGEPRRLTVGVWQPEGAGGRLPLVVFSHGSMGIRDSNESMFLDLASHGYAVVSVEHPGHALFSTDLSGERRWIDRGYLGDLRRENAREDPEGSLELYRGWMAVRIDDIGAVLDDLLSGESGAGVRVDPGRIALVGHSLGGSAALGAARAREDIGAAVALEAPFLADITAVEDGRFVWDPDPFPVPVLAVYSDSAWGHLGEWPQYGRNHELLEAPGGVTVHLEGVGHLHLTDLALSSPLLTRLLNGHSSSGDARATLEALNGHVLRFLDEHLAPAG